MLKEFSEGDACNSNLVNICLRLLNIFLSRVTRSVLTKLGIKHLQVRANKADQMKDHIVSQGWGGGGGKKGNILKKQTTFIPF